MKNRNRFVCILLTIVLILFSGSQVSFAANNKPRLSEMTDTALFDYMLDLGLIIPKGCDVPNDNIKMVKHYVCQLEDDRPSSYSGGMVCYRELFENVRIIVFNYYGGISRMISSPMNRSDTPFSTARFILPETLTRIAMDMLLDNTAI